MKGAISLDLWWWLTGALGALAWVVTCAGLVVASRWLLRKIRRQDTPCAVGVS